MDKRGSARGHATEHGCICEVWTAHAESRCDERVRGTRFGLGDFAVQVGRAVQCIYHVFTDHDLSSQLVNRSNLFFLICTCF